MGNDYPWLFPNEGVPNVVWPQKTLKPVLREVSKKHCNVGGNMYHEHFDKKAFVWHNYQLQMGTQHSVRLTIVETGRQLVGEISDNFCGVLTS